MQIITYSHAECKGENSRGNTGLKHKKVNYVNIQNNSWSSKQSQFIDSKLRTARSACVLNLVCYQWWADLFRLESRKAGGLKTINSLIHFLSVASYFQHLLMIIPDKLVSCGPRWLNGPPREIRLCYYGWCWNSGCWFESGEVAQFLPNLGDHTSCIGLNKSC